MAGSLSLDGLGRPEIQDPTRNVVVHCCDGKFTPQEPTEDAVHDRNLSIETAAIFTNILNSCARVLAIPGRKRQSRCKGSDPALGWILALGDRARSGFSPSARGARVPEARWERPSALGRQAAAFRDGHAWQERDRLASNACAARGGRTCHQVSRHGVACAEVHLVRRLSSERRVWKHVVVFVDLERHQSANGRDALKRVGKSH
jgi:hypothetical protein